VLSTVFILKRYVDIESPIFIDLFNRLNAFDNAFNERSDQYVNFLYLIFNFPFGVGLGLLSHKASDLNLLYTTPDGNYYRIFGELGFLGFISFLILILSCLYKSYKQKLRLFLIIIMVYFLQAFGTNVFDLYVASFFFWYVIGQVNGFSKSRIYILE
jgi:O-antigen ligase